MTSNQISESLLVVLSLLSPVLANAQLVAPATVRPPTNGCSAAVYDLKKEIKVHGTITKIEMGGTRNRIHARLSIESERGVVSVQLGYGRPADPGYLGISIGQPVEVTGMMEKVGPSAVLLARIVTTSDRIALLRNECGIPLRGTPRNNSPKPKDKALMPPKF